MEGAQVHAIMMEDFRMKGNNSMQMDKKSIKFEIRRTSDMELWGECFVSSITPSRPYITVHKKVHVKWTKNLTKAILYMRTGALQFKTTWKVWNIKNGKGVKRPFTICAEEDTLDHAKECSFMYTKWNVNWEGDEEVAGYLVKLNRERMTRFKQPIL